jgi:tetratricopeptide (TPR) repeat protein
MMTELPERLDRVRPALELALSELPRDDVGRAPFLFLGAEIESAQNRLPSALALLQRAERGKGEHPAILRARGDSLAAVWRFGEAAEWYRRAASVAPENDSIWQSLALSLGSSGQAEAALQAAHSGLERQPRGEQLLRSQALSLKVLSAGDAEAARALDLYLTYRISDEVPRLASQCRDRHALCAREQLGVHLHELLPVDSQAMEH